VRGEDPALIAYIGISGSEPTRGPGGALVTSVEPDSPAARAGLRTGDVVRAVEDEQISSMSELALTIRSRSPGDRVVLAVLRDSDERRITVELGSRR
jgi:S1-C subfamily serine protease